MGNFYKVANKYFPIPSSQIVSLAPGIYDLKHDNNSGVYLENVADIFEIVEKIYGNKNRRRAKKIVKLFISSTSSAVLLVGHKGTGKSLTAKYVSNKLIEFGYKIILLNRGNFPADAFKTMLNHLNKAIIIIDEVDKIIAKSSYEVSGDYLTQDKLLSILDGANKTFEKNNIHFIFTANLKDNLRNEFFFRPSRIKYVMEYDLLDEEVLKELIDDKLKVKDIDKNVLINKLSEFPEINFDLVLEFINELNQGYSIEETAEDFGLISPTLELIRLFIDDYEIKLKSPILLNNKGLKFILYKDTLKSQIKDNKDLKILDKMITNKILFTEKDIIDKVIAENKYIYDKYIGKNTYIEVEVYYSH